MALEGKAPSRSEHVGTRSKRALMASESRVLKDNTVVITQALMRLRVQEREPHQRRNKEMDRARITPVRWLGIILLSLSSLYVLSAILVRIMRRIRPGLTPLFAAPQLTMPWRWRFFGTPEQILDHAGVVPGMQVLEIGPGPGAFTVPLARRVAAQSKQGRMLCVEIQPEMVAMLHEHLE